MLVVLWFSLRCGRYLLPAEFSSIPDEMNLFYQNHNTWAGDKPLRILERSVFSDRLVFVRAVHEAQWLSDMQLELYDSWFNPMLRWVHCLESINSYMNYCFGLHKSLSCFCNTPSIQIITDLVLKAPFLYFFFFLLPSLNCIRSVW